MDKWFNSLIGAKNSNSKKRKKEMTTKYEIRRNYGLFEVYANDVLVETFVALYAAKEYIAKVGA